MLGGEDQCAETSGASSLRPGPRIEPGRIEDAGIFAAVAPLAVGEGVDAEVQEEREFVALPRELRGRWTGASLLQPRGLALSGVEGLALSTVEGPTASAASPTLLRWRNTRRFMPGW